jgi:hypothetical protein
MLAPFLEPTCLSQGGAGLSFGLAALAPAVLDRSAVSVARTGLARQNNRNDGGFFLSELPPGYPKGIRSDHHWFVETSKGVPTNRAGTPDRLHLERPAAFAKALFAKIPAKMAPA